MCDVGTWVFQKRDYARERETLRVASVAVGEAHPLKEAAKGGEAESSSEAKKAVARSSKEESVKKTKSGGVKMALKEEESGADDPLSGLLSVPPSQALKKGGRRIVAASEDPLGGGPFNNGSQQGVGPAAQQGVVQGHPVETTLGAAVASDKPRDPAKTWAFRKQAVVREFGGDAARMALQLSTELTTGARALPQQQRRSSSRREEEDESKLVQSTKAPKMVERSAARLEQLESSDVSTTTTGGGKQRRSVVEYATTVERLLQQMQRAWSNDERVEALKAAIQTAKLLSSCGPEDSHYPALFVLCTDVLDAFGRYVYDRIEAKKQQASVAEAKETCRNWFYKTACVRDLAPRFYVETALLRCYRFLSAEDLPKIGARLGQVARGLGNPVVANFARAYLARVAQDAQAPEARLDSTTVEGQANAVAVLNDALFGFGALKKSPANLRLARPALDWLLTCAGADGDQAALDAALAQYREYCNDAWVLKKMIETYDARLVSRRAAAVLALAKRAEPSAEASTVSLLGALGASVAKSPPPRAHRLAVLNETWKIVTRCNDLADYVDCAAHWLYALLRHYTDREVKVLLADVVKHVQAAIDDGRLAKADTSKTDISKTDISKTDASKTDASNTDASNTDASSKAAQRLEDLVQMLVSSAAEDDDSSDSSDSLKKKGASVVLASDHLLKLLDLFRPHRKVEIAKELLAGATRRKDKTQILADPVLVHTVLEMARVAHDSLDSLSPDGERRHVAGLLVRFVDAVDMGKDLERQLAVYVECRAAFSNLDAVLDRLVLLAAKLAVDAKRAVARWASNKAHHGGAPKSAAGHTQRAANFAKACLAFCHVTIPSIATPFRRFHLHLLLGHVALLQACLPHADTFFKAAVAQIPDLPADQDATDHDDARAADFDAAAAGGGRIHTGEIALAKATHTLAAGLVLVPGRPDHGPLYLLHGLINALPRYQHWQPHTPEQVRAHLALLPLIAAHKQQTLPYSVPGVEANDVLYGGGNADLNSDLQDHLRTVLDRIVRHLADLGKHPDHDPDHRANLILDLVNLLHAHLDLRHPDSDAKTFANKLVGLVHNKINPDPNSNTATYLRTTAALLN